MNLGGGGTTLAWLRTNNPTGYWFPLQICSINSLLPSINFWKKNAAPQSNYTYNIHIVAIQMLTFSMKQKHCKISIVVIQYVTKLHFSLLKK